MQVRGKFECDCVKKYAYCEEVSLHAVFGGSTNAEDNTYASATPSGELKMTISNPKAYGSFVPGKKYYLDITEAS